MAVYILMNISASEQSQYLGRRKYEEALAQSVGYFVAEVIYPPTCFCVRCCALALEMLDSIIEDLQCWNS
jgi:hypothetical protein